MKNSFAPYQLFFPIGIAGALLAVGIWLLQGLEWLPFPAILVHSRLIAGGFLWSFITGFLMTAVPRMTGTESAVALEYAAALVLVAAGFFCAWILDGRWFYFVSMLLIGFLLVYAGRRILRSAKRIPVFFSHVALGMALGLGGAFAHYRGDAFLGIHLYHVGAVLLLVLGIGTRFFSFLSGLPSIFEDHSARAARFLFHGLGVATAFLLFLAGKGFTQAYLGLCVSALIYLFFVWRIQRASARASALKFGVRIVALMVPLSFLCAWLDTGMLITSLHLLFIGCFGIITLSVATRVVLAHGSYSLNLETKSPALWIFLFFLLAALTARISYGFMHGEWRNTVLQAAAVFWVLALLSWCYSFLAKIWKPGLQAKPSC